MPTSQTRIKSCDTLTHDEVVAALIKQSTKATAAMVAVCRALGVLPAPVREAVVSQVRASDPAHQWLSNALVESVRHLSRPEPS